MMLSADYPPRCWSGIGAAVAHRAEALARRGVAVDVLISDAPGKVDRRIPARRGRRLRVVPLSRRRFPTDPARYDLIHLHSLRLAELALELQRRFKIPLVTTVHGMPHLELAGTGLARRWARVQARVLRASQRVVFLSRAELEAGLAWLPEIAERGRVVPHGLPADHDPPPGEGRRGPIVFAGRFAASKGMHLLEQVIAACGDRVERTFVLAGGHGDATGAAVIQSLRSLGRPRCHFPGWLERERLDCLLGRAAVVLVPSRYEPFGLIALEAMARGAPVLAADVGGLRDTVRQGSGGVRLADRDPRIWAARLSRLLTSGEARELGRRGPSFVRRHYSSDILADRLLSEVYSDVLGVRSPVTVCPPTMRSRLATVGGGD